MASLRCQPGDTLPTAIGQRGDLAMTKFQIRENGKNGSVEVLDDRIIRVRKKRVGKKDIQTIPVRAISGVHHDRKTLRTDEVRLDVGSISYNWKVANAEEMVAALHEVMFKAQE